MGFWSRLGKGTLASVGVITTPFLTGLGVLADGITLFVATVFSGFGSTTGWEPTFTKGAVALLEGSRTLLHQACAPGGGNQSFISKAIESSILGLSFIASAATALAVMVKAIPVLTGAVAAVVGAACVGVIGAAAYHGYNALTGNKVEGSPSKAHEPSKARGVSPDHSKVQVEEHRLAAEVAQIYKLAAQKLKEDPGLKRKKHIIPTRGNTLGRGY